MKNQVFINVDKEDFLLRLHPIRDKNNRWTGDVIVGIIASDENDLNDKDYAEMLNFSNLVAVTIPLMEEDEGFREAVKEYLIEKERLEEKPRIEKDTNSNVVRLHFNSKIDGSA